MLALALAAGCGDTTFLFAFNSGVIVGPPSCTGPGGHFQLRDQAGLVLLVVITSDTVIVLANGGSGRCADLATNAQVGVDGGQRGDQITAKTVTVTG